MLLAILFSLIFNFSTSTVHSPQTNVELYHVIVTNGVIINKKTGQELKRGAKISSTDEVLFKSKDAKAIVISTKRGRFVLAPKKTSSGSELVAFVNDVVSPLKSNSKLSTRGLEDSEEISDLQNHFGDSVYVILGDTMAFKVAGIYPMNANNFLTLRYVYKGTPINKVIGHAGNIATLDKNKQFVYKNEVIPVEEIEKVDLYYLKGFKEENNGKGIPELITSFKLIFLDKEAISAELREYATLFEEGMDYNEKLDEFYGYILDVYGPTDKHALDDFLKANNFKG
ncbi:MAG: hypothetical protein NW226_10020 [Microscillaceae bacterium]|nr:hypothetical protein [Microscillaceae bacterium]